MSKSTCAIVECDRQVNARQLCGLHYAWAQRAGQFGNPCSVGGCSRARVGRGLCNTHYAAARARGEFRRGTCVQPGCPELAHARKLCRTHYGEALEAGAFGGVPCVIDGCDKRAQTRKHCKRHYVEARIEGRLGAKPCAVDGCGRFAVQTDKCPAHLRRARAYGLTNDQLAVLMRGVSCEICGAPATDVDHCHKSDTVRGYLCSPCNLTLGKMRDRADLLRRAADYLDRFAESTTSPAGNGDTAHPQE